MWCVRRTVMVLGLSLAAAAPCAAPAGAEERVQQEAWLRQAGLLARVELALERLDYRIDAPDGLPDAALAHFRHCAGLPTSGPLNEALVAALEAAADQWAQRRLALYTARHEAEERLVRADLLAKADAERRRAER